MLKLVIEEVNFIRSSTTVWDVLTIWGQLHLSQTLVLNEHALVLSATS